ncbi:MAG TPA: exosortase H, partial [Chromatiales bacterium]|nr:exosortase H [Chromatiales bacterium]
MGRFLGRFTFLLTLLLGLTLVPAVHERLVQPWTATVARVAVDLAGVLDPDVIASGDRIVSASSGFAVRIEAGCNGVEPTLMLLAA